jgi:hypothetical protein
MSGQVAAAVWSLDDPPVGGVSTRKPETLFPKPASV